MHAGDIGIDKPTVGIMVVTTQWRQCRSICYKDKQDDILMIMNLS